MVRAISAPAGHLMHLEATEDTHEAILACLVDISQSSLNV